MSDSQVTSTRHTISDEDIERQFEALEAELDTMERFHAQVLATGALDLLICITSNSGDPVGLAQQFGRVLTDIVAEDLAPEEMRVM